MKPQKIERALGAAQGFYFCRICDNLIEDLGEHGIIMYFDEDGIYHTSCYEARDLARSTTQLTLWDET